MYRVGSIQSHASFMWTGVPNSNHCCFTCANASMSIGDASSRHCFDPASNTKGDDHSQGLPSVANFLLFVCNPALYFFLNPRPTHLTTNSHYELDNSAAQFPWPWFTRGKRTNPASIRLKQKAPSSSSSELHSITVKKSARWNVRMHKRVLVIPAATTTPRDRRQSQITCFYL